MPGRFFADDIDPTAAKRFGERRFGPIAFGSSDLPVPGRPSFRPLGQFAVGALVGYTSDPVTARAFVSRDVVQRNDGG